MNEKEADKNNENLLICMALKLGFKELGDDKYECDKDQLKMLISLSVKHVIDGTFYD